MRSNLSQQSKDIIDNNFNFRKILAQVLPSDIIDYIMELIAKDAAHENYIELTKD